MGGLRPFAGRSDPVLLLLVGTGLAQALGVAASPLLTRLFDPQAFAALAAFGALLGFFGVTAGGRYEMAIVLPGEAGDARALLRLALALGAAVSGLLLLLAIALLALPGVERLVAAFFGPGAGRWSWLLPPAVFLTVALAALSAWLNRHRRYGALAAARIVQALSAIATACVLGVLDGDELGLIWGTVAGLVAACLWLASVRVHDDAAAAVRWRDVARRYADFPRVNLPHALLDQVQNMLLVALIGAGWGASALGMYALVLRVVRSPLATIGSAAGQVFQQRAAQARNEGRPIRPLLIDQWRSNALWLLLLVVACVSAPWTFAPLFGPDWREGGTFALLLLPWMAASFAVAPLSSLPLVFGRQRAALGWGLAYHTAMLGPLVIAWTLGMSARLALLAHSLVAAAVLAAYAVWLWRLSGDTAAADHG